MQIREITFEEILPVWKEKLWPNRKSIIEPVTSMLYLGGYNIDIKSKNPFFFAIYIDDKIVGVNSGVSTGNGGFRSRGLWVDDKFRSNGLGKKLLDITIEKATYLKKAYIWSIPRKRSLNCYLSAGFIQTSEFFNENMEFGPNCYVKKDLI